MSLVAYGGSSDEDSEDENQDFKAEKENGVQEDKAEPVSLASKSNEEERHFSDSDTENEIQNKPIISNEHGVNTLLKALPAPKTTAHTHVISADDDLEEEVKPKAYQTADAPKPPPKKKKQPVKITIPSLQYDSDDENEPKQKKQKIENKGGKSGLTSILPPPMHSATKETNRTFLPYIFSKKKTENNSTKDKVKKSNEVLNLAPKLNNTKQLNLGSYGSDSDEDEDDNDTSSNFFSLNASDRQKQKDIPQTVLPSSGKTALCLPPPVKSVETNINVEKVDVRLSEKPEPPVAENKLLPGLESSTDEESVNNDNEPLQFNSALQNAPLSFKSPVTNRPYPTINTYNSYPATEYKTDTLGPAYINMDEQMESYRSVEDNSVLQEDEEFLRLQGKNQRGKEKIEFIDVNADDFISTADYQKSLSEETEYRSSHKKKDGPTSQQKRKHQITYLAHQAKERELELKNAWSQNKMTKKQTQAKYGF